MNIRSPLIFLTGVLVGSLSTYHLIGSSEVPTDTEINVVTKTENTITPQKPAPATIEVLDVPKYPEQENDEFADTAQTDDVPSEEVIAEDADAMTTQVEKFERSIASEEQAPASEEALSVEDPKLDEPEPNAEPDQGIE